LSVIDLDAARYLRQATIEQLWLAGNVRDWYLKSKQKSVLEFLRDTPDPFFEASRRYGKTTSVLAYDIEESILRPSIITRWCEPWKNQCREIVMTEMDQIQREIPVRYRFKWSGTDSYYRCVWNDSRIYLRGVNEDKGESARGPKAHIVVCDELGSWRDPTYTINEILLPQLLTTNGKLIKCGTPPRLLTHQYYAMKKKAEAAKKFIQRLIYDQQIASWEKVEEVVAEMGGWNSPGVQREMLCKEIVDPNFAVCPEWDDKYVQAVERDEFFPFYKKYDSLDIGVRHNSVCLQSYYDFRRAQLVVLDEVVLRGADMTTERMAEQTREKERVHFGARWETYDKNGRKRWRVIAPPCFSIKRVSDIDLLLVNDMQQLHGLFFEPTDKGALEEMVNALRIFVGAGKLRVHPRCVNLIDCLKYGIWDEHRKKWEEDERLGHFDALASLMYLVRNVDTRTNPIPLDYGKPSEGYFFPVEPEPQREKFKKMFGVREHGRIRTNRS
jgi:hypothetical protein